MDELLNFIEDKDILLCDDWYFHTTSSDVDIVEKILNEGIKSAYLRRENGNHFNGKYYISLFKNVEEADSLKLYCRDRPKFIVQGINPYSTICYSDSIKYRIGKMLVNTKLSLRISEWPGEYQEYLWIDPDKIVAIEYSLFDISSNSNEINVLDKLRFLRELVLLIEQIDRDLPIYDLSSKKEINKEKVKLLKL